jgi:hypothetical protein
LLFFFFHLTLKYFFINLIKKIKSKKNKIKFEGWATVGLPLLAAPKSIMGWPAPWGGSQATLTHMEWLCGYPIWVRGGRKPPLGVRDGSLATPNTPWVGFAATPNLHDGGWKATLWWVWGWPKVVAQPLATPSIYLFFKRFIFN